MHPQDRVYAPHERPLCEVLIDGQWRPGEVRAWFQRDDGWWANVSWSGGVLDNRLDTVPADRVRAVEG